MKIPEKINQHHYDVIIIGAGPAGMSCSLALKESGLSVAVLEKAEFPRDKICGDAIPGSVPGILNSLSPQYANELDKFSAKTIISSCRVVAPNQTSFDYVFKNRGLVSARMVFDFFLYNLVKNHTSVKIFQKHPVRDVRIGEKGIEVKIAGCEQSFSAEMVIGADGANAVSSGKLTATRKDPDHYSVAVRAYYENVAGMHPDRNEIHFLRDYLPGYFWIFPLPDNRVNVGFGMLFHTVKNKKVNLKKSLISILRSSQPLAGRFRDARLIGEIKGFGLPLGSRKTVISGERFLLTGDAASLINPASGDGIGNAMISGVLAADQIRACFRERNFSEGFMKTYERNIQMKLGTEFRNQYLAGKLIGNRPWVLNLLVGAASGSGLWGKLLKKLF